MTMSINFILMATNELRDTCPDLRISSIVPAVDGVCFHAEDGYIYKYEYVSGCIYRRNKNDWRTGISPVIMKRVEG